VNADLATWELVLNAARKLKRSGRTPFKLEDLVVEVHRVDPERDRSTIQPIVQGMTDNAKKGPRSACGVLLHRVERGFYELLSDDTAATASHPTKPRMRPAARTRILTQEELQARIEGLIADFVSCVETYDAESPFRRQNQLDYHRQTIDRRRFLGSVDAAIRDNVFTSRLHDTLQVWGLNRRQSKLATVDQLRNSLRRHRRRLVALEPLQLETLTQNTVAAVAAELSELIADLGAVENTARVVAGTKALHHVLPELVPPMDRAWTGTFFGWSTFDPQNNQTEIFTEAFTTFAEVARATRPSHLVGSGWRTSPTKILDNALIGYCKRQRIGPTSA